MNKTIAIVNDPDVTLGTLPSSIITINAWEADWKKFNLNDNYIILEILKIAYSECLFFLFYSYLRKLINYCI